MFCVFTDFIKQFESFNGLNIANRWIQVHALHTQLRQLIGAYLASILTEISNRSTDKERLQMGTI